MNELRGTTGWKSISQSEVLRIGSGTLFGYIVASHSSGKIKVYDGVDSVLAVKANSTFTVSSGLTPAKFAESVLTAGGAIADGDTVTIGAITYRFKDTLAQAYDVKIGASDAITLDNLKLAINGTGVAGTNYFAGTVAHALVIATTNTDTTQKIVSRTIGTANNALATTETGTNLSWEDTTLGGGTGASIAGVATAGATFDINGQTYYFTTMLTETVLGTASAVANEILWVTSDAVALDNMKLAINGTGVEGTDYGTGTQAHPNVVATDNANASQKIEARVWGTLGNAITTTETITGSAWTGSTLSGGANGARLIHDEFSFPTGSGMLPLPAPADFVNGLYIVISSGTATFTPMWSPSN